jgi:hypothetical protein
VRRPECAELPLQPDGQPRGNRGHRRVLPDTAHGASAAPHHRDSPGCVPATGALHDHSGGLAFPEQR